MNEFVSKSSFIKPSFVASSAWLQHIPFAFWLVEKARPRLVVELGVHTGVSYFAFCHSVKINQLDCTCYGVDTWQGDNHAGFYDVNIYNQAVRHNEVNYGGFSYLIRSTFDEACSTFTDGSIDLLHIDGYHTYDAVKNDYERWKSKLSDRAIVLFHDINVRQNEFGVYKLWSELKKEFKNFEFRFGFGLGILAVGKNIPDELQSLFSIEDEKTHFDVNYLYEHLGLWIIDQYKILQLVQQGASLEHTIAEKVAAIESGIETATHQTQLYDSAMKENSDLVSANDQLAKEKEILYATIEIARLTEEKAEEKWRVENSQQEEARAAMRKQISELNTDREKRLKEISILSQELTHTKQSEKENRLSLEQRLEKLTSDKAEIDKLAIELQNKIIGLYETTRNDETILRKKIADLKVELNTSFAQLSAARDEMDAIRHNHRIDSGHRDRESQKLRTEIEQSRAELISLYDSNLIRQNEVQASIDEKNRTIDTLTSNHEKLLKSYEEVIATVRWYQRTYEQRSYPGVIKQKLGDSIRRGKVKTIDTLLNTNFAKRKYVASYLLEYIKAHGFRNSLLSYSKTIGQSGFKAIINPRKLALSEMQSKRKPDSLISTVQVAPLINFDSLIAQQAGFNYKPKISIVITTYNTKPDLLVMAIESIEKQIYSNWELCIVDDCSTNDVVRNVLKRYSNKKQFKIDFLKSNSGISTASNHAIKMCTGEFIALMDHDDAITQDALFWVVNELNINPNADIIYSDECKVDENGKLSNFFFKPDWSPELLLNMMYVGHLTVYRRTFLTKTVGLFRKDYDFSQDYDLMLRATEKTKNIFHIKRVLYHWRLTEGSASQGDKPYARISNLAALGDAMKRRGVSAEIQELPTANRAKLIFPVKLVSIIIPSDSKDNLSEAINSIISNTDYKNYEIIAVTNSKLAIELNAAFGERANLMYALFDRPYNFSAKCNVGVQMANGEYVIIFNDDVRPLCSDWLENTIEFLHIDHVGGVSPKLLYENDTIQYAGMAAGVRNLTGTTFHCYPKDSYDYLNFAQSVRNVSILSGACMAMTKSLFNEVGGFDEINTPIAHSDVDISFKILEKGYRCVYTPYATLRHYGHMSIGEMKKEGKIPKKDKADIYLLKRWLTRIAEDTNFPAPMREHLYHDSPEHYQLYTGIEVSTAEDGLDILLISHDFSLSGAPIMLLELAKCLTRSGHFVTVVCDADGPLREMLVKVVPVVIVDSLLLRQHPSFVRFARNFDNIICNTVVTWPVVKQLGKLVRTIWWLHEAKVIELFSHNQEFVETLRDAQSVVAVSNYSLQYIRQYHSNPIKVRYGYYDISQKLRPSNDRHKRLTFSIIGSLEHRKGQDILVRALQIVEHSLLENVEIWIIGRFQDQTFADALFEMAAPYPFIKILGERNHKETLDLIAKSDVVISASRDDPFPVVLIEAFCLAKPCIVSTNTGQCEIITDGIDGFVFQNENFERLAEKISYLAKNRDLLEDISKKSRILYEKYLTIDQFQENMLALLNTGPTDSVKPLSEVKYINSLG